MGRPKKGEELGASVTISLRLTPDKRTALDRLAKKNRRSLTDELRAALNEHIMKNYAGYPVVSKSKKR
jgi:hypothetical protein